MGYFLSAYTFHILGYTLSDFICYYRVRFRVFTSLLHIFTVFFCHSIKIAFLHFAWIAREIRLLICKFAEWFNYTFNYDLCGLKYNWPRHVPPTHGMTLRPLWLDDTKKMAGYDWMKKPKLKKEEEEKETCIILDWGSE